MKKEELREKIREEREREWITEALRARKFSGIETFEQGLSLIDFAMRVAKNAKHRRYNFNDKIGYKGNLQRK